MKNKLPLLCLIFIILLAAFLRLYKIADYMTFLGDEGRDVLVAKDILQGHFTLLGPRASAGDFFLGPVYYYLIAPWLLLFNYDPVGPAVMVALFGAATVWFTCYVGKKWFNQTTGLLAAALYAFSPLVITYSHSSWNPDVVPFFALLMMFLLYKGFTTQKSDRYFWAVGLLLGILLQLHYLSLFLAVVVAFYTFFAQWIVDKKFKIVLTTKRYLEIFVGFLIGFSPFLAFEARHGFPNIRTIISFIFSDVAGKTPEAHLSYSAIVSDVFFRVFARLVFAFPGIDKIHLLSSLQVQFFSWFTMILAIVALIVLWFVKNKLVVLLTALWLFVSVLLFGFYKKPIYDYYFVILFPLPFLIIANLFSNIFVFGKNKVQRIMAVSFGVLLFLGIVLYNIFWLPFWALPNRQKEQAKMIAEFVISKTDNKLYNFALMSKGNSDQEYRYFLEILHHDPVTIQNTIDDPQRKTVTDQLLIVCEDPQCHPLGYPLFDVAGFGRAEVAGEWKVSVVRVFKLVHYHNKKP